MAKVTNLKIGVQEGTTNTLYVTWSFASKYEKNLDHYSVNFYYYTGQGIKFDGGSTDVDIKSATYTPPDNASSVYISVRPVSKKYKSKKKEVSYWTGTRVGKTYSISKTPPEQLSAPNVELDDRTLTVTVDTTDELADRVEFYVTRDKSKYSSGVVSVSKNRAQYVKTIGINGVYRVKVRAINVVGQKKVYGEWSEYSSDILTRPNIPTYVTLFSQSETSVRVSWDELKEGTVDSFEVQCVPTRDIYFNDPSQIKSTKTDGPTNWVIVSGLEAGREWFFRVRSINEQGESPWSTIKSIKIGTKPEAPTTWSLSNSVMVGDDITLYWVHNSEDSSIQQEAEVYLSIDGREKTIELDTPSLKEDDKNKIYECTISTKDIFPSNNLLTNAEYVEGYMFQGNLGLDKGAQPSSTYGYYSVELKAGVTYYMYPRIRVLSIFTTDYIHEKTDLSTVNTGQPYVYTPDTDKIVYVTFFKADVDKHAITTESDPNNVTNGSYAAPEGAVIKWKVRTKGVISSFSPWSELRTIKVYAQPTVQLNLENSGEYSDGILYSLPLIVDITAGPVTQKLTSLMIEVTAENTYDSEDELGRPVTISAGTSMYRNIYNSSTNPRTVTLSANYLKLEHGEDYRVTVTTAMNSGLTATESEVFTVEWDDAIYDPDASVIVDPEALAAYIIPYCTNENDDILPEFQLSVYRREFDGSFTEIGDKIKNTGYSSVTDPHPALDFARYRIVSTNMNTGSVGYVDLPGIPVGESSIVIQWDEDWVEYDYYDGDEDDETVIPPWCGSMLRLPYNVDISEKHDSDKTLVSYIGREHPISYYGTQRGSSATWNCVIPKDDNETLHALRRLANWMDDVYVREPSGTGYWAQMSVSMDVKHKTTTIPVTFEINRVEGDII